MGLQLSQIKAQTNLMNAESAKAYAGANKIKGIDTEAGKTEHERINLKVQEHIIFKEFDRLVSEINGINLDNDQKTIIKNSLQKNINSQIYLKTLFN